MNTHTDSELDTLLLLQTGMEVSHRIQDTQTRSYCSMRIIFMGMGIAEIDEQTVTQELGNVPVIAANHLRTGGLVGTYHVPVLFGVELGGKPCGIDQVAEHHGELPTFRVRRYS